MMASNLGLGASANQNANERENFNGSFASYSMSRLGSERSSFGTASGLSKPRLVKVRKHVGSQTVKSVPKPGNRIDAGFNPFRPGSSGLHRVDDDSKTQNSKSFTSDSAQGSGGLNNSGISTKDEMKFGKSEDVAFVFGANQSGSSSSFKSEKGESSGNMGESFLNEMKKLNTGIEAESRDAKCFVFGLNASRKWSSGDKGDFEFGSSCETKANLDGNMVSGLPSEMGKSTIDVESTMLEIPEEMKKLNINTSRRVGGAEEAKDINLNSGINDKNTFAFGSGKKTADSFAGCSAATLPDKMKKLNAEGPGNVDDCKNDSDEKIRSNGGNTSLYENRKSTAASFGEATENVLPNEARKLNDGSGIEGSYDLAGTGFSSSRIFVKKQPGNLGEKKFRDPVVATSTSFSSSNPSSQRARNDYGVHSMDRTENKNGFSFTSAQDELGAPHGDLRTPNQDASFSSTGNMFGLLNRKLEFSTKKGTAKDLRLKKKKGKLRQIPTVHKWTVHDFVSRESSSQENMESPGNYSPMDFSPYLDTSATEQCSREASVTSDESFHLDKNYESSDIKTTVSTDATDELMIDETACVDINGGGLRFGESKEESCGFSFKKTSNVGCPGKEVVPESESDCTKFKSEQAGASSDACVDSVETEALPSSNIEKQGSDCRMQFGFASSLEDSCQPKFTFAASSSSQCYSSVSKHHNKKINQTKVYHESHICTPTNGKVEFSNSYMQFSPLANTSSCMRDTSIYQSEGENKSQGNKEQEVMHGSTSAVAAAQKDCEKWRLRGNQAYANGNLSAAEDYYSRGINCISSNEMSRGSLRALVLCYSNRAATRMSLGRMREALGDCLMAAAIDPDFVKVQVRTANCHLALGEVKDAMQYFKKCLQTRSGEYLERKIEIEASDGLQKAQKVAECMEHSTELLQRGTSHDVDNALRIISEALLISSYSERLLEMKADALFVLQKYEEVIQLCEQTLDSAEKNFFSTSSNGPSESMDVSVCTKNSPGRIWRWRLTAKSYFYLGRLEEALDLLEKQEQIESITEKSGGKIGSPIPLAATVRELLQHKAAGNDAFQSGRHAEAVEHYTAALSCNIESHPFAAICFCNRAAAHQALGQITDAIADCNLSIALDGNYLKAISRRAALLEMIRDYAQAAKDLQRLVSLLEMQSDDKVNQSLRGRSTSSLNDVKQARLRISMMEEQSKKGIPLDMYLILGVETSGTVSDIKKAYRKGALRHHPDKVVQLLARTENGDDGLWKEIVGQVHKDADRLFKMIGEAYAVLSDPTKRSRYDQEEEMRKLEKKGNENSGSRTHSNTHKYQFEKQWQEAWKSYGSSHSRWSETSRSNM